MLNSQAVHQCSQCYDSFDWEGRHMTYCLEDGLMITVGAVHLQRHFQPDPVYSQWRFTACDHYCNPLTANQTGIGSKKKADLQLDF